MNERGTSYIKADAFVAEVARANPGEAIIYATGDIAYSAPLDPELFTLRRKVWQLYEANLVTLTQRPLRRQFAIGGRAFDYIATRLKEKL